MATVEASSGPSLEEAPPGSEGGRAFRLLPTRPAALSHVSGGTAPASGSGSAVGSSGLFSTAGARQLPLVSPAAPCALLLSVQVSKISSSGRDGKGAGVNFPGRPLALAKELSEGTAGATWQLAPSTDGPLSVASLSAPLAPWTGSCWQAGLLPASARAGGQFSGSLAPSPCSRRRPLGSSSDSSDDSAP